MAALFPPEYIGGMMSGCGIAGIVAISLRIITKLSLGEGANSSGIFNILFYFEPVCNIYLILFW